MGRASLIQHSFNAGELSALLLGRQDLDKYAAGLYVCLNAVPLTQGAWTRRPGTKFLHQTKHHDKTSRLIPFQYSITDTYILEFGEEYIRFYTDHGVITQATQAITGINKANPAVVTYSGDDNFVVGDRIHIQSVAGMTQVNNREFVVGSVDTAANTITIENSDGTSVDSTGYDTYTSGGTIGEILEIVTEFQESELADVRVTQSSNTLYILHPDYPPQALTRASALSWTLADLVFTDGPYDTAHSGSTTMTPSAATGTGVTLTASAVTGINDGQGFLETDVGRLIRLKTGSSWGYVVVTAWTSTTVVTVEVLSTLTDTTAKSVWRMGVWSETTGYPVCGTFYDDRLFLAGPEGFPQRLDGSKTGVYTSFAPSATDGTVAADSAVSFVMNSDDVNAIKWMASTEKGLLVGTSRGEWQVRPSTLTEALTPTNITARPTTRYGSAAVAPIAAGKAVLFVQRAGRKLREMAYVFEVDGFKAPDMSMLSEHITRPGVVELAFQQQPQSVVWAARDDGVLLGMTYERDQSVIAWHRHELGGQSDEDGEFIPVVESVAVIPAPDATRDELYVVVQRYVNGAERRYIEYMSKLWEVDDDQPDAFYTDCGATVTDVVATDTMTALWHLEGETVGAYIDGMRDTDITITNGKAVFSQDGLVKTIGYYYNSDGQNLPLEGGSQDGSAQGKVKRVAKVGLWLVDTLGLKIGLDSDTCTTEILVRQHGALYGEATSLFTGVVRERLEGDYNKLGQVYWRADGPFPATVLAIMPQVQVSDDS